MESGLETLKINNEFIAISLYLFINSMWFECCANYFVCQPHIEIPTNNPTFWWYPETKIETARQQQKKYKKRTISEGKYWYCRHEIPFTSVDIILQLNFFLLFPFHIIFFGSCFLVSHSWIHMHSITCIFQFKNCVWYAKCSRRVESEVWTLPFAQMRYKFNLKFERDEHLLCRIISGCRENWSTSTAHCTSRHIEWFKWIRQRSQIIKTMCFEAYEYLMRINATLFCTKKKRVRIKVINLSNLCE